MLWEGSTIGKFKFNFEVFDVLTARDADIFLLLKCLVHFTDYVLFLLFVQSQKNWTHFELISGSQIFLDY